jgi:isopentenyl-diphosphate Delta-isomerase
MIASMADEQLILVNERNRAIGAAGKDTIHRKGLLHRAFSIFLVDEGGLWANSCCGHPRPGERTITGAGRRLNEELGITGPLSFGFFSRYRAELDHGMQENEYVYVFFGGLTGELRPDPAEVADTEFLSLDELRHRIHKTPEAFTYWLRHYVRDHGDEIKRHADKVARRPATR